MKLTGMNVLIKGGNLNNESIVFAFVKLNAEESILRISIFNDSTLNSDKLLLQIKLELN